MTWLFILSYSVIDKGTGSSLRKLPYFRETRMLSRRNASQHFAKPIRFISMSPNASLKSIRRFLLLLQYDLRHPSSKERTDFRPFRPLFKLYILMWKPCKTSMAPKILSCRLVTKVLPSSETFSRSLGLLERRQSVFLKWAAGPEC